MGGKHAKRNTTKEQLEAYHLPNTIKTRNAGFRFY